MLKCKNIRQQIIDLVYGEDVMNHEIEDHLKECKECFAFFQDLCEIKEKLGSNPVIEDLGLSKVNKAVRKASQIQEKRSLILDLTKFAGLIFLVFSLYFLLFLWKGIAGLNYTLLVLNTLLPFTLIPINKFREQRRR